MMTKPQDPFLVRWLNRERMRFPAEGATRAEFDKALDEARELVAELEKLRAAAQRQRTEIMPLAAV